MNIIGIDPGSRRCGYAVVTIKGSQIEIQSAGYWNLMKGNAHRPLGERLEILHREVTQLFKDFNPRIIGLGKAVSFKSVPAALTLSEARGVIRLALYNTLDNACARLIEISPTEVKRSSTGSGASNKEAIRRMLLTRFQSLNSLSEDPEKNADTFDAIAVAWAAWIKSKNSQSFSTRSVV